MSSMFGGGFKATKCKTLLRLAMARIKLLRNKRDIQIKQMRKEIAQLLSSGQEASARIRVEHIAREQNIMAAYDIIELFCELIIVRLPIIESQKVCPMDLKEAVSSLIFASPRCADLPELLQIRGLFTSKYGKEFVATAAELRPDCGVNRRIIEKLSVRAPSGQVKLKLLTEIAAEHNVNWDPTDSEAELTKQPEDLLDGPKKFFGASESPGSLQQPSPPKQPEQSAPTVPPRAAAPAPSPPAPAHAPPAAREPIQMNALYSSESEEDAPSGEKKQFIPFVGPVPPQGVPAGKGSQPGTKGSSSSVSSTKGVPQTQTKKEEQDEDYDNVAAAAKAAAVSADRAVAAARAAAELAKTHPSKREPILRNSRKEVESSSSEEESEVEEEVVERKSSAPGKRSEDRRPVKNVSFAESHDSGRYQEKQQPDEFYRSNPDERREESFRRGASPDERRDESFRRSSYPDERREESFRRGYPDERREDSFRRSYSEERREDSFRRSNSGDNYEASFGRNNRDEEYNTYSGSNYAAEEKPEKEPVIKRFDSEKDSFWRSGDQDWRQAANFAPPERKFDSGGFYSDSPTDLSRRDSDLFTRGSQSNSGTSKVFSSSDSARDLFKTTGSPSEEKDLRRTSDEGFVTPKFDDDEAEFSPFSKPTRLTTDLTFKRDDDYPRPTFDSPKSKPSFNEFSPSPSFSYDGAEEAAVTPKMKSDYPEKQRSDSYTFDNSPAHDSAQGLGRSGSDPLTTKSSYRGDDPESPKQGSPTTEPASIPTKSRRTRRSALGRDSSGESAGGGSGGGLPHFGRLPKYSSSDTFESGRSPEYHSPEPDHSSAHSFDDSPNVPPKTSLLFYNSQAGAPPSASSAYESPEAFRERGGPQSNRSSPGLERKDSPSAPAIHPKLPDYDDLSARFEALKGKKSR